MHESAQPQLGHIDKTAEVAHVDDDSLITPRLAGFQLRPEEGEEFGFLAVALGVAGVALGFRNVIGGFLEGARGGRAAVEQ